MPAPAATRAGCAIVGAMRAVLIVTDLLTDLEAPPEAVLAPLSDAGLALAEVDLTVDEVERFELPHGLHRGSQGLPHVRTSARASAPALGPVQARLLDAAASLGATPDQIFLLTDRREDARAAAEEGFRPILVLGARSLDEALGPGEPGEKHVGAAPDLETAVGYAAAEHQQHEQLGAFPYARPPREDRRTGRSLSTPDLARLLGLVVLAGTAIALGIAYFLREIYETWTLPPVFYYLTLQFLPEWGRGILFLLGGVAIGVFATRTLGAARRRTAS